MRTRLPQRNSNTRQAACSIRESHKGNTEIYTKRYGRAWSRRTVRSDGWLRKGDPTVWRLQLLCGGQTSGKTGGAASTPGGAAEGRAELQRGSAISAGASATLFQNREGWDWADSCGSSLSFNSSIKSIWKQEKTISRETQIWN